MRSPAESGDATSLPKGFRALPIHQAGESAPLRICVLVQQPPDDAAGPFVLLRDLADASVYLGCITDAAGRVHEWIEVWIQNVQNLAATAAGYRQPLSNHMLDERWKTRAEALRMLAPERFIVTGWESEHPAPIFFDAETNAPVNRLEEASGAAWELCTDDTQLAAAGLPAYRTSLFRYLWTRSADGFFVPVAAGAPENERTQSLSQTFGNLLPFNRGGGLMLARSFAPIEFEEWIDLLAGEPWPGVQRGRSAMRPGGVYQSLSDANVMQQGGGHLFLGHQGKAGRLLEAFHLRLQSLLAACRAVRAFVQTQQVPFLNLSAESFRVSLAETDFDLPLLWTGKVSLAVPSEAVALPIESTEARYFIPADSGKTSIYRPATLGLPVSGRGDVRIRKVLPGSGGSTTLEGTLVAQEKINAAANDLLWIRLTLGAERVDLYARMESDPSLAQTETRFRTLPQSFSETAAAALQKAEGVPFPKAPFETVPLWSTPCDLYSLGVLAVRAFFVNHQNSLPVALDEILSLAQLLASHGDASSPMSSQLAMLDLEDARWRNAIGPQRLLHDDALTPEQALAIMPVELWWETVGAVLRMFPGTGLDGARRDFGDADPLALERVFDQPVSDLERLLVRSRSLITIDWNYNREIRSVIGNFLERQ